MKNRRKGVTLAEISIVLAVVAIISTVVVTFTMNIGQRSNVASSKLDALNEVNAAKVILATWAENIFNNNNYTVTIEDGSISATDGTEAGELTVGKRYRVLAAELPNGEVLQCPAETIGKITFTEQVVNGRSVVFCTLEYTVKTATPKGIQNVFEEITFCIYSAT